MFRLGRRHSERTARQGGDSRLGPWLSWQRWLGWPGAVMLLLGFTLVPLATMANLANGLSIDRGPLLEIMISVAVAGLLVGVARRGRAWWATWGAGIAATGAGAVGFAAWFVHYIGLVSEHYPSTFLLWIWVAWFAIGVALTGCWSGGSAIRVARALTAALTTLSALFLINAHYGYWPTVGVLLGKPADGQVSGERLADELQSSRNGTSAETLPVKAAQEPVGQYAPVRIAGNSVGFSDAEAYVWLPPDFFRTDPADESVVLMMPGWPGGVQDWVGAGGAVEVADAWAREHDGAAPVMVFVDENGGKGNDTECVNGPQGQAESYLTEVIPHYLEATLGIPDVPQRWATVGFSEGGTCAVGLALGHPGTFGRFVDLAGDLAPDYGPTARSTLANLYGYNRTAEEAHEPLYLLSHGSYPQIVGWFGAGTADRDHLQVALQLAAAAGPAGIDVHEVITPGGHSWSYASNAFARIYAPLVSSLSGGAATGPPVCPSPGCTTFAAQHPVRSPAPSWASTRRGGKRQKDHPV